MIMSTVTTRAIFGLIDHIISYRINTADDAPRVRLETNRRRGKIAICFHCLYEFRFHTASCSFVMKRSSKIANIGDAYPTSNQ